MDRLLEKQAAIQKKLAKKHLKNKTLVLYDITSVYFEGEHLDSELIAYGYNRDKKKGKKQIVVGLLCAKDGSPVAVEVFPGNTQDAKTVEKKIEEIQKEFGVEELVFVGDRGMVTKANYEKLKDKEGLKTISALTRAQMDSLLEEKTFQLSYFDEKNIVEVIDKEDPHRRYCLCKNPIKAAESAQTRLELLSETCKGLERIQLSKKKRTREEIGAVTGLLLEKYKIGKYVRWGVRDDKLVWEFDQEKIDKDKSLDGCYVIQSNVSPDKMTKDELVKSYRSLSMVESAFRYIKTVQLEVRPVYHQTDDRIRAHVFLCMLAYYLQWHFQKRLQTLFEADGTKRDRQWTLGNVIRRLGAIRKERASLNGVEFDHFTTPNEEQKEILKLLDVRL